MKHPTLKKLELMRLLARMFPIAWMPEELERFDETSPIITARKHVPSILSLAHNAWTSGLSL